MESYFALWPKRRRRYKVGNTAVLNKNRRASMQKKLFTVLLIGFFLVLSQNVVFSVETQQVVADDFTNIEKWSVASWGDGGDISISDSYAAPDQKSLKLHITEEGQKNQGKGVVIEKEQVALDISSTDKITLDMYNAAGPMKMALVLHTGDFCESFPIELKEGENKDIVFDLKADNFKSSASKWEYNYSLKSGSIAWRLMFIFYREKDQTGDIYISNLRFDKIPRVTGDQTPIAIDDYEAPQIKSITAVKERVNKYKKFEADISFSGTYQYPYNPKDIALDAEFTSPSGKKYNIPGFLYDAKVNGIKLENTQWKIRFTPNETGEWSYKVVVKNHKGSDESDIYKFKCLDSDDSGFIRVSTIDPKYFEFDSGEFYYPIGQNVAWANDKEAFDYFFKKMSENGYNWTRMWMSSWQFAIEWLDIGHFHGLGTYSLENAKYLDEVIELTAKYDLYFQLVLNNHGQLSTQVDAEWLNNPYNAKNGGPCKTPQDFFTNEEAKDLFKQRMRYIIARWGYSPHILAWELWNEVTLVDDYSLENDVAWSEEMANYIKELDPFNHLITTSYFGNFPKEVWKMPIIDYGQIHMYTPEIVTTITGLYNIMDSYEKPYFVGEFGTSNLDGIDRMDPKATNQHAALWSQFMTPSAGDAMCWEWDNHIDPNNLYYHWKALSEFAKNEDRRCKRYVYSRATITAEDNKTLTVQGILNRQEALCWIYDLDKTKFRQQILAPLDINKAVITIEGMLEGEYLVEFWDTYKGQIIEVIKTDCQDSKMTIELPQIRKDIACKIKLAHLSRDAKPAKIIQPHFISSYPKKDLVKTTQKLWEDFSNPEGWGLAAWGDEAELKMAKTQTIDGTEAIKISFNESGRRSDAKGIVFEKYNLKLDISDKDKMVFDIYNATDSRIEASIMLDSTGFCESIRKPVDPGLNRMVFDLNARNFKKSESRWTHGSRFDKSQPVGQVMVIVYPWDVRQGTYYIDNITFE
jgi:hypothetical protein